MRSALCTQPSTPRLAKGSLTWLFVLKHANTEPRLVLYFTRTVLIDSLELLKRLAIDPCWAPSPFDWRMRITGKVACALMKPTAFTFSSNPILVSNLAITTVSGSISADLVRNIIFDQLLPVHRLVPISVHQEEVARDNFLDCSGASYSFACIQRPWPYDLRSSGVMLKRRTRGAGWDFWCLDLDVLGPVNGPSIISLPSLISRRSCQAIA